MNKQNDKGQEEWKDIPDYKGYYQVSSFGRVRSLTRKHNCGNGRFYMRKGKILTPALNRYGYLMVNLSKEGKASLKQVHVLVMKTFKSYVPDRTNAVVDHIDNDRTNNKLSNLQIVTQRKNTVKEMKNKFTGTTYNKLRKKWYSRITINGKTKHLGVFSTQEEAHKEYKIALENHNETLEL